MTANLMTFATATQRVGVIKGQTLKHAVPKEVLSLGCTMENMPMNSGDTVIYRRWLPYSAVTTNANTINRWSIAPASHIVQEGVTPQADVIVPQDVQVTINQYAAMYSYTDKAALLYEDDIPEQMKIQCGERMGLVREMIRYGALKGCTNAFFSGGTTRATVAAVVGLNFLRNISLTLLANHADMKTRILSADAKYDTSAIEAGFIVFSHTDLEADIRDLPGFVPTAKYGNRQVISEYEIGAVERFRFITSPELVPYLAAGAAVAGTTLFGTANADVYPMIIMGNDAAFDVALRGARAFKLNILRPDQIDKSDPGGQRGYVSAFFWSAALVTNNGWMAVAEVARTALS